jgi:hypothetical protein
MNDRLRKRDERRRDREAAIAKQAAADDALRNRLVAGCFNNAMPGPGIQDMAPVKAMIADGVPMEHILIGLKRRCDRRIDPQAPPLASWREEKFLVEVARAALLGGLLPHLVATWKGAGTAPAKATERTEASSGTPEPAPPEDAPAAPPSNGSANPGADEIGSMAAALLRDFGATDAAAAPPDDGKPVVAGRESVLAAFARNRTPPQPAAPQPRPPERQAEPEITEAAFDEYVAGWVAGNIEWPRRMLGPAPGESGCRVPLPVLKRNRLA